MKKLLTLFISFTLLVGCRPDVETANWNVDALTPLINTSIDFRDLVKGDSTLVATDSGLLSVVFRNKLVSVRPGEVAPPLNNNAFNTVKITSIEFGTRVIREQITLGQIAQQAGLAGQIIIASNGSNQAIPPINGLGPYSFPVDATEFFQSITLRDGWLILRLENQLPAEVTNLQYEIVNQSGGAPLLQNNLASLMPAEVHFDSVQLINNVVITGQLNANLLNVDFPGTGGNQVPIDTSDALNITLTVDKLDPVEATAIFPAQDLYQDTVVELVQAKSAKLTSVHVASGKIFIDASSTVDDEITLEYLIPGGTRNGQTLGFIEQLPPAPFGGSSQKYTEVPIENYDIDLTGLPGSMNVFNQFYTIFNARVDSSGKLVNLSLQDSVYVNTGVTDLNADRGYGFMGYDTSLTSSSSPLELIREIVDGSLTLDNVKLDLEVENYVGAPIGFKVLQANSQNYAQSSGNVSLTWDKLGDVLLVPPATENFPGNIPSPGRATFNLNNSNSNIQRIVEVLPDSIEVSAESYLNPNIPNTDLSQFLYTQYGIDAFLNVEVPLHVGLQNLTAADTAEFLYEDLDSEKRLRGGQLKVLADNFYPFNLDVSLVMLDAQKQALDTLEAAQPIAAASIDATGRALSITKSIVGYPLSSASITNLQNTSFLVFLVRFNTTASPDKVKIYADNYLNLQLVGDFSLSTK